MLSTLFNRLEAWHINHFVRPWLGPLPMSRTVVIVTVLLAAIAVFANVKVRHDQGEVWKANSEITTIAGALSFSTADAPYFLAHAAAAKEKLSPDSIYRKRHYPNREIAYQQRSDDTPVAKRPLLSTLISLLAPSSSPGDLLTAGHKILIVSAGVTALTIILAFGATGYWLEGTAAAIGGGLSSSYLIRSSFGRIDTDQLNLGLMYLMFALIMLSARSRKAFVSLIWAAAAGSTASLFMAWYGKPQLVWMAIASYVWIVVSLRKDLKFAAGCLLLFYALAPVSLPNLFSSAYLQNQFEIGGFLFPNTLNTVTEVAQISFFDILISATGSIEMGLVCLIGLALWATRHPVMAVTYGPLIAFALLNYFIGNRAVFYSAPILWFGAAFFITSTARFVAGAISSTPYEFIQIRDIKVPASLMAAMLSLVLAWVNVPSNYVPRPSFPKPVLEGFSKLGTLVTSESSVVATWWDYGYASLFLNKLPTLHDGGTQTGSHTHFFAYALLSSSQLETIKILQFLTRNGQNSLRKYTSKAALFHDLKNPKISNIPDIYLVLTSQMDGWVSSIAQIGNWDIETGRPASISGNNNNSVVEYIKLGCDYHGFPSAITCGSLEFDFNHGLINKIPAITGWTFARDGMVQNARRYNDSASLGVQTLQINNRLTSQMMHSQLYRSSYNKLFHLGLIEEPGLTLFYDDYPHIRIYKIAGSDK